MINTRDDMKAKLNGILKYAKRLKRFQSGGVTFMESPTMYNPEEDFYMKSAYARYNASQKKDKTKSAKAPEIKADYLTNGPKGTRDHYNNVISSALADYRNKVMSNGVDWSTSASGLAEADKVKRIIAEANARNSAIEKDRAKFTKDLTDNDLTSVAFFGGYFVRDKQTNVVDNISTEEYLADPSRYEKFTTDEMLRYADSQPQESSKIYQMVGSIAAGNKFIKENIKSEKAVADGQALSSNDLRDVYTSILNSGSITEKGLSAGIDQVVENQLNSIMSNHAAKNNIYRRVYENPTYVAKIVSAKTDEEKTMARVNAARAEVFRLIYMHGTPTHKSGNGTDSGGKKLKWSDPKALEAGGYGLDKSRTITTTDLPSHFSEGDEEVIKLYKASRVPETKNAIAKINQTALQSTKENISASLAAVQAFGDLKYLDMDRIYSVGDISIAGENGGLFDTMAEAKNNLVFTDNDMARVSMPSLPDGAPLMGMGEFLKEFKDRMKKLETPNNKTTALTVVDKELHDKYKNKVLQDIVNEGSPEAQSAARYLLYHKGGTVPVSNKLATEVYAYVVPSRLENYPTYTEVENDEEIDRYFKMNPNVEKVGFVRNPLNEKPILVKIPVYVDFLPSTDIAMKMDASITDAQRKDYIEKTNRPIALNDLLEEISPYTPQK